MNYCSTSKRYGLFLLFINGALVCAGAFAQANSELTGIVRDQSGAVVAGAKIALTDPATGITRTTVSSSTGLYDISGLNPANYDLKVRAAGFASFVRDGIAVNVSSTARVDVNLIVDAESQTITVRFDSLAIQSNSHVISTLVSSERNHELNGGRGRNRTYNLSVKSRMLCQLSYASRCFGGTVRTRSRAPHICKYSTRKA